LHDVIGSTGFGSQEQLLGPPDVHCEVTFEHVAVVL